MGELCPVWQIFLIFGRNIVKWLCKELRRWLEWSSLVGQALEIVGVQGCIQDEPKSKGSMLSNQASRTSSSESHRGLTGEGCICLPSL